jgi:stage III sporulation protein AC
MNVELVMRAIGIAFTVAISCTVLSKTGRDDQTNLVSLAGIIALLTLILGEMAAIFDTVRDMFGL